MEKLEQTKNLLFFGTQLKSMKKLYARLLEFSKPLDPREFAKLREALSEALNYKAEIFHWKHRQDLVTLVLPDEYVERNLTDQRLRELIHNVSHELRVFY